MNILAYAIVAGQAGFWMWVVLNDPEGLFRPVHLWMQKGHYRRKWMDCPWCSGAWFSLAAAFGLQTGESITATIVIALAGAAIAGLLGSYFGED